MKFSTAIRSLFFPAIFALAVDARAAGAATPSAAEDSFDLRQVLLRENSVTVSPGQWQVDVGLNYVHAPTTLPGDGNSAMRSGIIEDHLRLGLTDRIEAFAGLPLAYAKRSTTDTNGYHSSSAGGFGDAVLGASATLCHESDAAPGTIFTLQAGLPTGASPYDKEQTYGASTGTGHTTVQGMLDFVRSSDPIVLFWGVGYQYFGSASGWDGTVKPGSEILYRLGIGFAVNRDASLIAETDGAYQFESKVKGSTISGSSADPVTLRLGVTLRIDRDLYLEPATTFGMTDAAPDIMIGLTLIDRGMF